MDQGIKEVLFWETEISHTIRAYFLQVSQILDRLNALNPPLKSYQLEPSLSSILGDRRVTMNALDTMKGLIDDLFKIKSLFVIEGSA